MASPLPRGGLLAAAQHLLRAGGEKKKKKKKTTRGLSGPSALQLAGEVCAVAAGLKPAFLYDYNSAGCPQVLSYLQQLQTASALGRSRLHVLGMADHVLIVNLDLMVPWLEALLLDSKVSFMDVSAARTSPGFCGTPEVDSIKEHVSEILDHLKALAADGSWVPSSSTVFSADWNLCTLFGVLLGYPAAYSFPAGESFDNCLALAPLRVFTVRATCCRISDGLRVRLYSFSVPENLYSLMKTSIDEWWEALQDASRSQNDFSDLCLTTEIITLEAVAL